MTSSERFEKFFPTILDVIYGIVLTIGFAIAVRISFPVSNLSPSLSYYDYSFHLSNYDGFIHALALILLFVLVISSWIYHRKSLKDRVYQGYWGNIRFALDISILFFYIYLITLTSSDSITNNNSVYIYFDYFGYTFLWGLPVIFLLYTLWDIIKYIEYKDDLVKPTNTGRMATTVIFFVIFLIQAFIWMEFSNTERIQDHLHYFVPIVTSIILMALFRIMKWMDEISKITSLILDRESRSQDIGRYFLFYLLPASDMQRIGLPRDMLCIAEKKRILLFVPHWHKFFELQVHYAEIFLDEESKLKDERKWPNNDQNQCYEYPHKNAIDHMYEVKDGELNFKWYLKKFDSIDKYDRSGDIQKVKEEKNAIKLRLAVAKL